MRLIKRILLWHFKHKLHSLENMYIYYMLKNMPVEAYELFLDMAYVEEIIEYLS